MSRTLSDTRVARRVRFRDLQVFFSVVECGSMAKAAAQLGVTQPAVSEIIAALESAFDVRLFDRGPQGVRPTIYGRALLKRGLAAYDELRQGLQDIAFLADPAQGEVRVGCADAITVAILLPVVQKFCLEYPRIALRIDQVPAATLELPDLHARKLDFTITRLSIPHGEDPFGGELNAELLFDDPPVVATGASSKWARRRRVDISELVDEPWIATPRETLTTKVMEEAFRARKLPIPAIRVMTFSLQLRIHLLATGNFLSVIPRSLLRLNAEGIGLKELPVKLPVSRFPVAVLTVKNRTLSPAVELFLERLRKFVNSSGLMH